MKRIPIVIAVLLALLALFGCGHKTPAPTPTATTAPTPEVTEAPTATPEITATAEPSPTPGAPMSPTTGLPFDSQYRPVMVSIENSAVARPQTGLQTADVVYEVPVEGGITRFVCIFSDNVPEEVMPVRSARIPFLYIQQEWDALFMHFGGSGDAPSQYSEPYSFYGHSLHDDIRIDVDGMKGKWNDYYRRVSGIKAPHNVIGNPLLAQALYDYDPEPLHWQFSDAARYEGEDGTSVSLSMCSGKKNYVTYEYDAEKDLYMRSMGGKKFTSAETREQVGVRNLIVQYSTYTVSNGVKLWEMTGEGEADFYIGGTLVHGSWEKESAQSETVFRDAAGEQITLRPGNTWIHIHPED